MGYGDWLRLNKFIAGELLEGENKYFCQQCQKKVKAVRKQYIKKLPKILVICLKRFEFDYTKMQKKKINDYFEYPQEIDMSPYTQNYQSSIHTRSFKYSLKSVLLHKGSSESGHYFTYIKINDQWYEFNDTLVKEFDYKKMAEESFGNSDPAHKGFTQNAYILFYQSENSDDLDRILVRD